MRPWRAAAAILASYISLSSAAAQDFPSREITVVVGYAAGSGADLVVRLIAEELRKRAGKPVIPRVFWYMSVLGSLMTLSYFAFSQKQDAVGIMQNLFPKFTAAYSLYLDIRHRGWRRDRGVH